jgi:nitroreductase
VNLDEALRARRSVRAFLDKPVPDDVLERVFRAAQTAPSWCNIQPWRVWVTRGEATKRLTNALVEAAKKGEAGTDYPIPNEYPEPYGGHRRACGKALYEAMGVGRQDVEAKQAAWLRNFAAFDAPVVAMVGIDKRFAVYAAIDVGCWLEALLLAATAEGLATCAQASLAMHAPAAHEALAIPDSIGLLFGVAIGYEDTAALANNCRTTREPIASNVTFVG